MSSGLASGFLQPCSSLPACLRCLSAPRLTSVAELTIAGTCSRRRVPENRVWHVQGEIAAFKEAAPQFPITYQIWESSHSLTVRPLT